MRTDSPYPFFWVQELYVIPIKRLHETWVLKVEESGFSRPVIVNLLYLDSL